MGGVRMLRVQNLKPGETEILVEILKLTNLLPLPLLSYSRALGELRGDPDRRRPQRLSSVATQTRTIRPTRSTA